MASEFEGEERFLASSEDHKGWGQEAQEVIRDIAPFVSQVRVSEKLPLDELGVYLNLQTKEMINYTVELTEAGFRICGHAFDVRDLQRGSNSAYFETPYALLNDISPLFRESFGMQLISRLNALLSENTDS